MNLEVQVTLKDAELGEGFNNFVLLLVVIVQALKWYVKYVLIISTDVSPITYKRINSILLRFIRCE